MAAEIPDVRASCVPILLLAVKASTHACDRHRCLARTSDKHDPRTIAGEARHPHARGHVWHANAAEHRAPRKAFYRCACPVFVLPAHAFVPTVGTSVGCVCVSVIVQGHVRCVRDVCIWYFGVICVICFCVSLCANFATPSLDFVHMVVKRGGRCLIPVFALGRAQELLLILGLAFCLTRSRTP